MKKKEEKIEGDLDELINLLETYRNCPVEASQVLHEFEGNSKKDSFYQHSNETIEKLIAVAQNSFVNMKSGQTEKEISVLETKGKKAIFKKVPLNGNFGKSDESIEVLQAYLNENPMDMLVDEDENDPIDVLAYFSTVF